MRAAITLAYNGKDFLGFQSQKSSKNTVAGRIQNVLSNLNIDSKLTASGRTDAGVHATGQVCHIDLPGFWSDLEKLKKVMNEMLPPSIHVRSIKTVDKDFHARYGAKRRVYRYIIKEEQSNPFEEGFVTFLDKSDFSKIQRNIDLFIGEHDFTYFMKTGSETKTATRVVYKAFAYRYKGYTVINFEANGFLRSQVRLMVAALLELDTQEIKEQLTCKKKHKFKPAKPNGLFLAKVKYFCK